MDWSEWIKPIFEMFLNSPLDPAQFVKTLTTSYFDIIYPKSNIITWKVPEQGNISDFLNFTYQYIYIYI